MTDEDLELVAFALAHGGASPDDEHLAADIVAVDAGSLEVIAERESPTKEAKMPLSLTDAQLATITNAAALLPPAERDNFLRGVAAQLPSPRLSDGEVINALRPRRSRRRRGPRAPQVVKPRNHNLRKSAKKSPGQ
jgi:hypothetical protein